MFGRKNVFINAMLSKNHVWYRIILIRLAYNDAPCFQHLKNTHLVLLMSRNRGEIGV